MWITCVNAGSWRAICILLKLSCWVKLSGLWFDFMLLTGQKASLFLVCECWRKTGDIYAREKEVYYSQYRKKKKSHAHQNVCISFSCPQVPSSTGATCMGPESGFALQLTNNNNLGEPTAIITSSEIAFCPRGRCYLIPQDCSLQTQP